MITELRRTGEGILEATPTAFLFTPQEHSASLGDIQLHLQIKHSRKEMPGSNKVVHQMLSATWQPFEIIGEWQNKWGNRRSPSGAGLGRTGDYAMSTFVEVGRFCSRMPTVRVQLDQLSFVCVITDFKVRYRRTEVIGWSMTFSPEDNETIKVDRPSQTQSQAIPKWIQDAQDQGAALQVNFEGISGGESADLDPVAVRTPRLDQHPGILAEINDALDRLQSVGLDTFSSDATNRLLLLSTTFGRLRGAGLQLFLAYQRVSTGLDMAFDDVIMAARYTEWLATQITTSWRIVGIASDAQKDIKARAREKPRAIYYPQEGENLERISTRFYGNPDSWRLIYDRNNLSSLVLDGTEELIIPERAART